MHHFILTRMSYKPSVLQDKAFISRRWELTKAVCAASLAGQTNTRFCWLVKVHRDDPLLSEKFHHMESLPFPVFPFCEGDWSEAVGRRLRTTGYGLREIGAGSLKPVVCSLILTTRLDDDDALAVDAVQRLQQCACSLKPVARSPIVLSLPNGYRSFDGKLSRVWKINNQFASLLVGDQGTRAGDRGWENDTGTRRGGEGANDDSPRLPLTASPPHRVTPSPIPDPRIPTVMDVKHGQIGRLGRVVNVDGKIGWLWVRHTDAKSAGGMHHRGREPNADHRRLFSIDWDRVNSVRD